MDCQADSGADNPEGCSERLVSEECDYETYEFDSTSADDKLSNGGSEIEFESYEEVDVEDDVALAVGVSNGPDILGRKDVVVADTGASCHVFMTKDWMTNYKPNETSRGIKVGGKALIRHDGIGDLPILFKDKDGNVVADVVLMDVKCAESFGFNLFSLTKANMQDW